MIYTPQDVHGDMLNKSVYYLTNFPSFGKLVKWLRELKETYVYQ